MTFKALLLTNDESIAVSPTEEPPYKKVNKFTQENVNSKTADVVMGIASNPETREMLETIMKYTKLGQEKVLPKVLDFGVKELGYVEGVESFDKRLKESLQGDKSNKKNASQDNSFSPKKNVMSPR